LGEGVDILQYKKITFDNPLPTYRKVGKLHRPGYAEMFDSETGQAAFSQGVTFGLIGQYSLDMPQKSFKVQARAKFGEKYFNAALFDDRPFDVYKSFVLRVSGNDAVWTRMADGVQSRLVDRLDTNVLHQAWNPVVVYLNGQYWGHYNMRERVSRYFVAQHEGMPIEEADNMTILEANGKPYWGSNAEYNEMIKTAKTLSPGQNPEDLKYLTDRIDVDNYFDYMILEAFFANSDTGNIRYYKLPGGKWRWILFDLDYGLFNSNFNGIKNILDPKGTGVNRAIDNTLIKKLMENADMQDKFLRRFGEIFRQLTTEVMLAQIDECYNILRPEMMMHFNRWASYNLKSIDVDQPQTVDGTMRYWNVRVDRMKNVVKKRPTICWDQVKDWFKLSDAQMTDYFGPRPVMPPDVI
ncbi:MAG TPA: CotH kinase family protein, partial [Clostridia bacterium]|nr:CotH kinase family protein [Clostridia bacterium]